VSGLCAGFELKRRGFDVRILEASSRVGGRVITFREPFFAPGLHGEGGAMRIPANHFLLRQYIDEFGLQPQLFEFEMENKYIYLSGMPEKKRTMLYRDFDDKLQKLDEDLLKLFPNLTKDERGKTCDQLFDKAVQPVRKLWSDTFLNNKGDPTNPLPEPLIAAYTAITKAYDKHSLRSYLTEEAKWSQDAINLYDLGNAHVVFDNGFIESFKDAFLSSNEGGGKAGMQQLANGMDEVPKGFLKTYENKGVKESLLNDITFGARVTKIATESVEIGIPKGTPVIVTYANDAGKEVEVKSDYLILAIPYTAQRAIQKSHAFDTAQEMAIRDVRYVEVTKVLLQYKERWWTKIFQDGSQGKDYDGGLVSDLPIRYTMFPKEYRTPSKEDPPPLNPQFDDTKRGVVMAAYTFEQDATILGSLHPHRRIAQAAANLDTIFPSANSLSLFEASASQVFPADELAGGSAFCYFGPGQKGAYLDSGVMMKSDWNDRVFFAGEQASFTHGWIQGALEAALRCVLQVYEIASKAPVLTAKEVTHEVALKGKEEVGQ
jgi:monoamine oxidase